MIISASYKTDIPTFYGEWFINRVRQGYCKTVNPFNKNIYRISLDKDSVEGFVFWTKNIGPFLKFLPEIKERGYPFVIQHTINGYPRELETSVVNSERTVDHFQRVSAAFGPKVCVWRYDTIIFSSLTPIDFHLDNFARLAKGLKGATDEVVISFAQFYKKTSRNLSLAAEQLGFAWEDPELEVKQKLASQLTQIAHTVDMQLSICSQPKYLVPGAKESRCVDAARLEEIAQNIILTKIKGNRKECGCFESRDIGEYDTCPHGCIYCYAVENRELALSRYKVHNPSSEFLFPPPSDAVEVPAIKPSRQLPLFSA